MNIITLCHATSDALNIEADGLWNRGSYTSEELRASYRLCAHRLYKRAARLSGQDMAQSTPDAWQRLFDEQVAGAALDRKALAESLTAADQNRA